MTTIPFDSLRFVETLKKADFTERQATALAEAFKGAWDPSFDLLATKGDIASVRADISNVRMEISESKVEIIKWVIGLLVAQTGLIIASIKWIP